MVRTEYRREEKRKIYMQSCTDDRRSLYEEEQIKTYMSLLPYIACNRDTQHNRSFFSFQSALDDVDEIRNLLDFKCEKKFNEKS